MNLENAVYPSQEQFTALAQASEIGPVCMLNLLKFKEAAQYKEGGETELTGEEAYGLYAEEMRKIVEREGGRFIFTGAAGQLVIGQGEADWDSVGIVEYPSREDFIRIATSPEVLEIEIHRNAGLEGQLLIAMSELSELS